MSSESVAPLALISDDASLQTAQIVGEGEGGGDSWEAELTTQLDMTTEGMVFMWPTWSAGGDQIAVSASSQRVDDPKLELWRLRLDDELDAEERLAAVFKNPYDGRQVIATGLAHYVHWAPSGRALAVVGNVGSGMAVNLVAASGRGNPRRLVDGAPLYFDWAPDGRAILVHRAAQLVLLDLASEAEGPLQVQRARPSFRSPAWSHDGSWVYFARPRPGGGSIVLRAARSEIGASNAQEELMEVAGASSFVVSPTDDRLAVMSLPLNDAGPRRLTILNPSTGDQQLIAERDITGICWSPDGRAIFAFEPQPSSTMISIVRYDIGADQPGAGLRLARFQPSAEFATLLSFFDQFAHSHQIVSPCGRWITFSGLALGNGGSGRRGFGPQNGCYLVPADGSAPPRRVAAGSISFFPRNAPAESA